MITNINKQIGLQTEKWGVEFPTFEPHRYPISAYIFQNDLLINIESCNFLNLKIDEVKIMLQSIKYFENSIQNYWNDEDYYGYVYLTYDQKNQKVYIGSSTKRIKDSKKYYGSGIRILNIKKNRNIYFLKKFILGVCYSREELLKCETECKYFFDAFNSLYGYNLAIYDYSPMKGRKRTEEQNKKAVKTRRERGSYNFSEEYKQNMRIIVKTQYDNNERNAPLKNKTYEEYYGEEKAKNKKEHLRTIWNDNEYKEMMVEKHKNYEFTEEHRKNCGLVTKDTKWINNGVKSRRIKEEELNYYLNNGWNLGNINIQLTKGKTHKEYFGEEKANEMRIKNRKAHLKKKCSEETKQKMRGRIPSNYCFYLDNNIKIIQKLKKEGKSYKYISNIFNCSISAITNRINKKGNIKKIKKLPVHYTEIFNEDDFES